VREYIKAKVQAIPAQPATDQSARPADEALVMAPYVVDAVPVRVEIPPPRNRVLEAVKTGKLFRLGPGEIISQGEVDRGGYARISLGVSFSW
jgi:hypothetical protein